MNEASSLDALAERCVRTLPRQCLDRILIINRHQLERVLHVYTTHYNRHRPHRSLSLQPPDRPRSAPACAPIRHIHRYQLLGGLINEYKAAASRPPPRVTEISNLTGQRSQLDLRSVPPAAAPSGAFGIPLGWLAEPGRPARARHLPCRRRGRHITGRRRRADDRLSAAPRQATTRAGSRRRRRSARR
jgi:hypothetical protein